MIYDLPKNVEINGRTYEINTDFRCILDIFEVLNDTELNDRERAFLALGFFYPNLAEMPKEDVTKAQEKLLWFIRGGSDEEPKRGESLVSWEHDFPYIIAPINRNAGHDIRQDAYVHWWSFLAYYMEIGESVFSQIISIRSKRASGKKLDKAEKERYMKNKHLVDVHKVEKYSRAELDFFKQFGGENNG